MFGASVAEPSPRRHPRKAFSVETLSENHRLGPSSRDLLLPAFVGRPPPADLRRETFSSRTSLGDLVQPAIIRGPLHGASIKGPSRKTYIGGPPHWTFTEGPSPIGLHRRVMFSRLVQPSPKGLHRRCSLGLFETLVPTLEQLTEFCFLARIQLSQLLRAIKARAMRSCSRVLPNFLHGSCLVHNNIINPFFKMAYIN